MEHSNLEKLKNRANSRLILKLAMQAVTSLMEDLEKGPWMDITKATDEDRERNCFLYSRFLADFEDNAQRFCLSKTDKKMFEAKMEELRDKY
mmetsp:Transcript_42157/g.64650  ORF Transcript_42157/g.64650 Transcript_42157/m.64650 type:complete len:92 (+) Transcript_42157:1242-1517(+)